MVRTTREQEITLKEDNQRPSLDGKAIYEDIMPSDKKELCGTLEKTIKGEEQNVQRS